MRRIEEDLGKVMAQQKFEWEMPLESDLAVHRAQFKNMYNYSNDCAQELNLFGENAYNEKIAR